MADTPLSIPQLGNRWWDYRDPVLGNSYNWSWNRSLGQVQRLVIHHSVTITPQRADPNIEGDSVVRQVAAERVNWTGDLYVNEIANMHVNERRWGGIGYHFIIPPDGVVYYVGDIGTARANVANHNEKVIGICLVGNFVKHLPTDIQINSAHDLCDFFLFHYPALTQTDNWNKVIGHKDAMGVWGNTTATACPGSSWPVDMFSRIKDNIVYTPSSSGETPNENTAHEEGKEETVSETDSGGSGTEEVLPDIRNDIDSGGYPTGDGSDPSVPVGSSTDDNGEPSSSNGSGGVSVPQTAKKTLAHHLISFIKYILSKIPVVGLLFG